ncbi:hypothetical protein ACQX09_05420 [Corynebacterium diphtheriae]
MSDLEKYAQNTQADVAQSTPLSQGALAMLNLEQQAHAMQNALSIAQAMCATQMVPKSYFRKPEDGAAAIMYGAELGLNAMQSLQQIMVINGKPGIMSESSVCRTAADHGDQRKARYRDSHSRSATKRSWL